MGPEGCRSCQLVGKDCIAPKILKRGPHKGYFDTISTVSFEVRLKRLIAW